MGSKPSSLVFIIYLSPLSPMAELKTFSREEVATHNTDADLWVIIDAKVYNLSKFKNMHPGGSHVLLDEEVGK